MKEVIQLVGRDRGQRVMMPYAVATACVAAGTAVWPEDAHKTRVRGLKIEESNDAPRDQKPVAPAVPESDAEEHGEPDTDQGDVSEASADEGAREDLAGVPGYLPPLPEGYVGVGKYRIPPDWRQLQWKQRVKIAEEISGGAVESPMKANEIIEAYLAGL